MDRAWIFVLGALIVLGGIYLLVVRAPQSASNAGPLTVRAVEIQESTDTYEINVKYPQFGDADFDAAIQSAVNAAIQEIKGYPDPAPSDSGYKNSLDVLFDDPYIGPDILSVKLILSQYTGGAHGMTIISGLNYDRATKKLLLPDDARKMVGLTFDQLSTKVSDQLRKKLGDAFFEEGANSNPENFSSFVVATSTVTFIFQPYQVAAYASGPQEAVFDRISQ